MLLPSRPLLRPAPDLARWPARQPPGELPTSERSTSWSWVPLAGLPGERAAPRRVQMLALPQLVAKHAYFEQKRCGVDATPDLVEIGRRRARRRVDDFKKAAFELVEHQSHRVLAGIRGVLPVEAARDDQILGPLLFRGDVLTGGCVHDVGEHALRPIEVVRYRRQQDPVARILIDRTGRTRLRRDGCDRSCLRAVRCRRPPPAR